MNNITLIAFGFGWMVVAALLGLYLGAKHPSHLGNLHEAAARGDLDRYHRTFEVYKWRSSIHAHGMLFALSCIAIGIVLPQAGLTPTAARWLIGSLVVATIAWTPAALQHIRPIMGLADIVFTGSLATIAWNIAANN